MFKFIQKLYNNDGDYNIVTGAYENYEKLEILKLYAIIIEMILLDCVITLAWTKNFIAGIPISMLIYIHAMFIQLNSFINNKSVSYNLYYADLRRLEWEGMKN